jgi:Transcription initiation factor IIA, gamma subunit, helical domain
MSYQVYRQSKLGDCLVEALDELITNEKITPALAMKILAEVCNCLTWEVITLRHM